MKTLSVILLIIYFMSTICVKIEIVSPHYAASIGHICRVVFRVSAISGSLDGFELSLDFNGLEYNIADALQLTSVVNNSVLGSFTLNDVGIGEHALQLCMRNKNVLSTFRSQVVQIIRFPIVNKITTASYGNFASYSFDVTSRISTMFNSNIRGNQKFHVSHESLGLPLPTEDDFTVPIYLSVLYNTNIVRGFVFNSTISLLDLFMGWSGEEYPSEPTIHVTNRFHYLLSGLVGVEIGGPSLSQYETGLYEHPAVLDCINYARETLWSSHAEDCFDPYNSSKRLGKQYISDIVNLAGIRPSNYQENLMCLGNGYCLRNTDTSGSRYDFVFASHVLEHVVNPLLALERMTRLLKPGGLIFLILPWKNETFDHQRPDTQFDTLLEYYHVGRNESYVADLLSKIIADYDLSRDLPAGSVEQFVERSLHHAENKALHVHVFNFELIVQSLEFFHFEIVDVQLVAPCDQIVIGKLRI